MDFTHPSPRRLFLGRSGRSALSAATLALLASRHDPAAAHASGSTAGDIRLLDRALVLAHELVAAYRLGVQGRLLTGPGLALATAFQARHEAHRDALAATLRRLGGRPAADKPADAHARALGTATARRPDDILGIAARLERAAADAHLGAIPSFKDPRLAQLVARLAADDVMHHVALLNALGQPLPAGALSFGG